MTADALQARPTQWSRRAFGALALASLAVSLWLLFLQVDNYGTSDGSFGHRTSPLFHRGYYSFWVFQLELPYWAGVLLAAFLPIWWLADKRSREMRNGHERRGWWRKVSLVRFSGYVVTASVIAAGGVLSGFGQWPPFDAYPYRDNFLAAVVFFGPPVLFWVCVGLIALRGDPIARRRSRGLCLACGYDLTANVSGTCPECGTRRVAHDPSGSGPIAV